MILVPLTIKAYVGKSEIKSAEKKPPVGIEPGTLGLLLLHILCYTLMSSLLR